MRARSARGVAERGERARGNVGRLGEILWVTYVRTGTAERDRIATTTGSRLSNLYEVQYVAQR